VIKVHVKAVVDYQALAKLIRSSPLLAKAVPIVAFQCGPFECETIEDVWSIAKEIVAQEKQAQWEKLREFAP